MDEANQSLLQELLELSEELACRPTAQLLSVFKHRTLLRSGAASHICTDLSRD